MMMPPLKIGGTLLIGAEVLSEASLLKLLM
jgi:hypothetical protein